MFILSFLFFLTAILYSSVGFGGGSTYLALLLIWDVPYQVFPIIALCCNIIVVSGNCFNYIKAGNINIKLLSPFLISSVPFAFIGGSLHLDKGFFEILLFIVLALAGLSLLFKLKSFNETKEKNNNIPIIITNSFDNRFDNMNVEVLKTPCVAKEISLLTYMIHFKKLLF